MAYHGFGRFHLRNAEESNFKDSREFNYLAASKIKPAEHFSDAEKT